MSKAKLCFFDIEASSLSASFGFMLSFGWKFRGEKKAHVISIADYDLYKKDPTNDKKLVKDATAILEEADIICGHYSRKFDLPFINTRLLYHNLPVIGFKAHIDTWHVARYQMKMHSNRLDAISKFLECLDEKSPVAGNHWVKAQAGNKNSLNYIIKHNKLDVLVLEQVYEKIRPLIKNHPNMNILDKALNSCPCCGNKPVQKRGWSIAGVSRTRRYWCRNCGHWSKGRPERVPGLEIR